MVCGVGCAEEDLIDCKFCAKAGIALNACGLVLRMFSTTAGKSAMNCGEFGGATGATFFATGTIGRDPLGAICRTPVVALICDGEAVAAICRIGTGKAFPATFKSNFVQSKSDCSVYGI